MLTLRENLLECIRGGSPDRYVNQFEAFSPMIPGNPLLNPALNSDGLMIDEWGLLLESLIINQASFPCMTLNTSCAPTLRSGVARSLRRGMLTTRHFGNQP